MVASGQVFYPEDSVGDNTRDEHLRFPASKIDHRVDAQTNLCLYLEKIWEANPPGKSEKEPGVLEHGIKVSKLMPPRHSKKKSRWAK